MGTKRREFIGTVVGGVVATGVVSGAEEEFETSSLVGLVKSPPVVMAPRVDGVEIGWLVSRLCRGWIEFENGRDTRLAIHDGWGFAPQGEKLVRVRLDGLEAGTTYRYRAITESVEGESQRVESEWREFRTLDPLAESTCFVAWNDTHDVSDTLKLLDRETPAADFLVWNGDACKSKWRSEDLVGEMLFHPGGADFTAKRPMVFTWGNHDVRGTYGFKGADYIASPTGQPYYAFRSGPVAVVALHTGEDKADDHPSFRGQVAFDALRREQAEWIEREVLTAPELRDAPYRVVFCHIPLHGYDISVNRGYDRFSERSRVLWHDALVKWGAQVVISGHTHRPKIVEASPEYPYAQIVGGGPEFSHATWIEGLADSKCLRIRINWLAGRDSLEARFSPIST